MSSGISFSNLLMLFGAVGVIAGFALPLKPDERMFALAGGGVAIIIGIVNRTKQK